MGDDCGKEDEHVAEQVIEGYVREIVGAWTGTLIITHVCNNNNKRDTSATISTTAVLDGPDAKATAQMIVNSLPARTTANGVVVTIVSAEVSEDGGISGGQIAGIILGSIGCFLLIVLGLYFALSGGKVDRV